MKRGETNRPVELETDSTHGEGSTTTTKWNRWIAQYFSLDLIYETDRFLASAGITENYQRHHNLTPVFGGWKEYMVESLP
jgi:hypothetical protein